MIWGIITIVFLLAVAQVALPAIIALAPFLVIIFIIQALFKRR